MTSIDPLFGATVLLRMRSKGEDIGSATGFFYETGGQSSVMSARHTFVNEVTGFFPDELILRAHVDPTDLRVSEDLAIPLYENGTPSWREHADLGASIDLAAVAIPAEIKDRLAATFLSSDSFMSGDIQVEFAEGVVVVGYPRGFYDHVHNIPILRQGTIASAYGVNFRGVPAFLIDAQLHTGVSGAPVFTSPKNSYRSSKGWVIGNLPPKLIGVVSGAPKDAFDDPVPGEPTSGGLNLVWYANLLEHLTQPGAIASNS